MKLPKKGEWTAVPTKLREEVIGSLEDDVASLRDGYRGPDDAGLLRHADALESLVKYLRDIEPTIKRQLGEKT